MVDALLDFLPPGSRFLRDEVEFTDFAFFRRPVTLPVEIAHARFCRTFALANRSRSGCRPSLGFASLRVGRLCRPPC